MARGFRCSRIPSRTHTAMPGTSTLHPGQAPARAFYAQSSKAHGMRFRRLAPETRARWAVSLRTDRGSRNRSISPRLMLERTAGIEPASTAWKADARPLGQARMNWWIARESNPVAPEGHRFTVCCGHQCRPQSSPSRLPPLLPQKVPRGGSSLEGPGFPGSSRAVRCQRFSALPRRFDVRAAHIKQWLSSRKERRRQHARPALTRIDAPASRRQCLGASRATDWLFSEMVGRRGFVRVEGLARGASCQVIDRTR